MFLRQASLSLKALQHNSAVVVGARRSGNVRNFLGAQPLQPDTFLTNNNKSGGQRWFSKAKKDGTGDDGEVPLDAEGNAIVDEAPINERGEYKLEGDEFGGDPDYSSFGTEYGQLHSARRLALIKNRPKPRHTPQAVVNAVCTKNNTHITVTDFRGRCIVNMSGGLVDLGGMKKGSPFGGQRVGEEAGAKLRSKGIEFVNLRLKGFGKGRNTVHRGLKSAGLKIVSITQAGNVPHNGCRPPKARRL